MVANININAYSDALVVLGTAGILIPIFRRYGVNPLLGYLGAGALLGPLGLGSFTYRHHFLYWFTIGNATNVAGIAELGIVFLLFVIGLELSFQRLIAMGHLVAGLGTLQVLLTTAILTVAAFLLGQGLVPAIVLGASLSLSSTAIVLEILSRQGRMSTSFGRASFAVLLTQDIAVIPLLMFLAIGGISSSSGVLVLVDLVRAILQASAAVALIVLLGRFLLRPLFGLVAATRSSELFIAAVLFVIVGTGVVAHQAGLSMALGAFIAGLLLAETEFRKAIQASIEPFKGLLLGIFFFTVGMNVDIRELLREPAALLACVVALIAAKSLILTLLARLFRISWPAAAETGLLLGPGGEFAFVLIGMAADLNLISRHAEGFSLAVTAATMATTPLLSIAARRIAIRIGEESPIDPVLAIRPAVQPRAAIVVGYGRVGKVVCSILSRHGVPCIATDYDAASVARDRREGHDVYYGDASNPEFLKACGLQEAGGVIITINSLDAIDGIVAHIRALRPDVPIISRARDADHARHLYTIGASDAVPETIEASLQLSEAALVGLGIATELAIAAYIDTKTKAPTDSTDLQARLTSTMRAKAAFQAAMPELDSRVPQVSLLRPGIVLLLA